MGRFGLIIVRCEVSYQVVGYAVSRRAIVDSYGVGAVSSVEFLHEVVDVEPDCLVAEAELECDLLICIALCYVSEYLELSRC